MQIVRKRKRNKAIIALFLPVIIFLWMIGWSLYWIGSQKQPRKTHVEPPKDHVHIKAIVLEEPREIAH